MHNSPYKQVYLREIWVSRAFDHFCLALYAADYALSISKSGDGNIRVIHGDNGLCSYCGLLSSERSNTPGHGAGASNPSKEMMALFLSMLPLYLFGNLHCIGMCGPLVLMIGRHRYRYYYFLGRTLSYSLAGMAAGGLGAVANAIFQQYHAGEAAALLFGMILVLLGIYTLGGWSFPGFMRLSRRVAAVTQVLSLLMLRDRAWPAFLFGFFTLMLPCGQTLIVFSACALSGDSFVGFVNGFAFAILTSPSLFLAMQAHTFLQKGRQYYKHVIGVSSLIVGSVALLRGFAEAGLIAHLGFGHFVIY